MPVDAYVPGQQYPASLQAQLAQADRLSRALRSLSEKASKSDVAFLLLLGRADEVRTLVDEILREWSGRLIETNDACEAIGSYVCSLHVALHRRYGEHGASCCGPHLESFEKTGRRTGTQRIARRALESGIQAVFEGTGETDSVVRRRSAG